MSAQTGSVRWASTPPQSGRPAPARSRPRPRPAALILAVVMLVACTVVVRASVLGDELPAHGALTLCVFCVAVWLWIFSPLEDTYVALGAALILVSTGVVGDEDLFSSLGEDTVWLLLTAFVIAAGVTASGLATRVAAFVVTGASGLRPLFHLTTAVLVVTAFAIPSTSGRAALALPVFAAMAAVLAPHRRVVLALSLLFPSVILLSAVASYLGAGAHLITAQILDAAGHRSFGVATWLILGLPLAVVSSHVCTELILRLFTRREDRREPVSISLKDMQAHSASPISGPLTTAQTRSAMLVAVVVVLWCSEPLHGLHPAIVGLLGALLAASPRWGSVDLGKALKSVPWSLLVFMAATLTLGTGLVDSGAADWLAAGALGPVQRIGPGAPIAFVVLVVVLSTAAHLVIQSRSARSAVLIPIVVALAPGLGVDASAAAFASTAAAGFCHTLTSSAKPMTLFSDVEDVETFRPEHLLRLSAWLAPISAVLVLVFAFLVWPLMGLPLFR